MELMKKRFGFPLTDSAIKVQLNDGIITFLDCERINTKSALVYFTFLVISFYFYLNPHLVFSFVCFHFLEDGGEAQGVGVLYLITY